MRTFAIGMCLLARTALAEPPEPSEALAEALAAMAELAKTSARHGDGAAAEAAGRAHAALLAAAESVRATPLFRPPPVMDRVTFQQFVEDLRHGENTNGDRIALVGKAARRHRFTVEQVIVFLQLFAKSEDRVRVAAMTYDHLSDPERFDRVYGHVPFESDRRRLALAVAR